MVQVNRTPFYVYQEAKMKRQVKTKKDCVIVIEDGIPLRSPFDSGPGTFIDGIVFNPNVYEEIKAPRKKKITKKK